MKYCNIIKFTLDFRDRKNLLKHEFQQNIIKFRNKFETNKSAKTWFSTICTKGFQQEEEQTVSDCCGLFDKLLVFCCAFIPKKTTFPLFSQYAQTLLRSEVIRFLSRTQNHVLYCPIQAIANRIPQKQGPIAGIPIGNTGPGNLTL